MKNHHSADEIAMMYNRLANQAAQQGNVQTALHYYSLAVQTVPDFTPAHFNLGLLFLKKQDYDKALIQFNNVVILTPETMKEHIKAQFYLGAIHLALDNLDAAETAFELVIKADPEDLETLNNLGVIALKRDQGQLAIAYFTKGLGFDNAHVELRANLAATFMHYDRFENALRHYQLLLKQDPENGEYQYNAGVAQMILGKLNLALIHFEAVLKKDPRHFAALNNIAAVYTRLGDRHKAKLFLEQALSIKPADPVSQHLLAAAEKRPAQTCPTYAEHLFNNYALYYEQHLADVLHYSLPQRIATLMQELQLPSGEKILDLGCGTGLMGAVLRPYAEKLYGVDIAHKMLVKARDKGCYDELMPRELVDFLQQDTASYQGIVAADVFPYFGDLSPVFKLVFKQLAPGGWFIFTTEISADLPLFLQETARFAHHETYLKQTAIDSGFELIHQEKTGARQQAGEGLLSWLMVFRRPVVSC